MSQMGELTTGDVRKNLAGAINRVAFGKERLVITRHGKRICAIVPMEDLTLMERIRDVAKRQDVKLALAERSEGATVSWGALKRELGLP